MREREDDAQRRVGLFGASAGAAAALQAATQRPGRVSSLVLRGGRAYLAADIARVQAPTMLIVGGADSEVLQGNRAALQALKCEKRLEIVPGATHLFEEPGALDARLAGEHLPGPIVVLALPRGGVPVAVHVARQLISPLDLLLVRKIGAPWQSELAVAAVVDGGQPEIVIDDEIERRRIVCLAEPSPFRAIGLHYADFEQIGDEEVIAALEG